MVPYMVPYVAFLVLFVALLQLNRRYLDSHRLVTPPLSRVDHHVYGPYTVNRGLSVTELRMQDFISFYDPSTKVAIQVIYRLFQHILACV